MPTTNGSQERMTFVAGEDLSSAQFHFVTLETDGEIDLADAIGETCFGVVINDPTAGQAATVVTHGVVTVRAGGDIGIGETVATAADGEAIHTADSTSATTRHMGIALEAAADQELCRIYLFGPYQGDVTDES
jgi:hypothetical protein